MLTCITCSKQKGDDEREESPRETPNTKEAVKTITSQIKDMALKMSGAYKQCKPCTPSSHKRGRAFPEFDTISEGSQYIPGSSSSTPAWDFSSALHRNEPRYARPSTGLESVRSGELLLDDEEEPKEWLAQVEPGVQITFVSLTNGGNELKRIRFSREMFDKWQAQRWWGENYDRIMELYNVQRFNKQALDTPSRTDDETRDSSFSKLGSIRDSPTPSTLNKEWTRNYNTKPYNFKESSEVVGSSCHKGESSMEASRTTTSSRDEPSLSISNASEVDSEWVEQDEPGIYITIRQLVDGTRELRRVRFSRERFGESHAKIWWEENKDRIQSQYL
ncbi:protein BREVIS RADIX-like [Impatiens glandulifera]|uniref:protein BREVIS RADIX-like n=1 Tax=Impatiens glandulifera TaxID=253017 RepID=UPI001FB10BF8|nr:protein BREVIS RADIX-like [Impatiens glandulifera]